MQLSPFEKGHNRLFENILIPLRRPELVAVWKIGSVNFKKMFAYVLFMVFRVYSCEKTVLHCDCSETGAISKYVSNKACFVWNISGKNATFGSKFNFFLNECMKFENLYGYCLYCSKKKNGESLLKYWKGVKDASNERRFDLK